MTERTASPAVRSFVRSAWLILGLQLALAVLAAGATGWAALQLGPLARERAQLERQIGEADARLQALAQEEARLTAANAELEARAAKLRTELDGARQAVPVLSEAIEAYHAKDYARAVRKYDEALKLDPNDSYIYNLKSYSQFKARDLSGARQTLSKALAIDPTYDYGYFDLARYHCAAGDVAAAEKVIRDAIAARGASARDRLSAFLRDDGEFRRLCGPAMATLRALEAAPGEAPEPSTEPTPERRTLDRRFPTLRTPAPAPNR